MLKVKLFIRKNVLFVRLIGELDQMTVPTMRVKISELLSNYNIKYLVLNCAELEFMDSSGIGFILGRYNELNLVDGKIILCEMNELITRIVHVSGVHRIVTIKKNEDEATIYVEGVSGYGKVFKNTV